MPEYLDKFNFNKFELPTTKFGSYDTYGYYGSYDISTTGIRDFTVEYLKNSIKVYSNIHLYKTNKNDNILIQKYLKENKKFEIADYFSKDAYFFPKISFVLEITNFDKVWLGFDKSISEYLGNTILVQIKSYKIFKYICIANDGIFEFISNEEILKFYSPINDEIVPCPVAFTKNKIIFFYEKKIFDRNSINKIVMSSYKDYSNLVEGKNAEFSPSLIYTLLYYNDYFKNLQYENFYFTRLNFTKFVYNFINSTLSVNKFYILIIILIIIGFVTAGIYITHQKHKIF